MSQHEANQDVFEYDGRLIAALGKVNDTISSYAIQNYSACGAVLFFYFTSAHRLPFWIAFLLIILLCVNFCLAIAANVAAAEKLYVAHRIAVEHWFEGKTRKELFKSLGADEVAKDILKKDLSYSFSYKHPAVFANAIPAAGAAALLIAGLVAGFR